VHDSDVLEPAPSRPGGLQMPGTVRALSNLLRGPVTDSACALKRHVFRAPAKLEPPTPRASVLGLDRLASEKRAAQAFEKVNGPPAKRARLDDGDEPHFKGK
jgi:pre-mRNA-splicing factor ATP-dependent RNA helicase DHX38/PRP16